MSLTNPMNPYAVLGVSPAASPEEIESAYHRLVKRYHPDRHADADERVRADVESRMAEVTEAMAAVRADMTERRREATFWSEPGSCSESDERDAEALEEERLARLTALVHGDHDPALVDVVAGGPGRRAGSRGAGGSEPVLSRTRLAIQVAAAMVVLVVLMMVGRLVLG